MSNGPPIGFCFGSTSDLNRFCFDSTFDVNNLMCSIDGCDILLIMLVVVNCLLILLLF